MQMQLSNGSRSDAHRMAVFISDGHSNINQQNTIPSAIDLRQTGCVVLVCAIGTHIGWDELFGIASDPQAFTVFAVNSYDLLSTIVDPLRTATADGKISTTRLKFSVRKHLQVQGTIHSEVCALEECRRSGYHIGPVYVDKPLQSVTRACQYDVRPTVTFPAM